MSTTVDAFIYEHEGAQREIMLYLHQMITSFPGVIAKIRYQIPFYDYQSWMCYLNPQKKGGVELAFTRANELSNANGLLSFKGRKQVAGITYSTVSEIDEATLRVVLQEAMLLNEAIPYASKRKKG